MRTSLAWWSTNCRHFSLSRATLCREAWRRMGSTESRSMCSQSWWLRASLSIKTTYWSARERRSNTTWGGGGGGRGGGKRNREGRRGKIPLAHIYFSTPSYQTTPPSISPTSPPLPPTPTRLPLPPYPLPDHHSLLPPTRPPPLPDHPSLPYQTTPPSPTRPPLPPLPDHPSLPYQTTCLVGSQTGSGSPTWSGSILKIVCK